MANDIIRIEKWSLIFHTPLAMIRLVIKNILNNYEAILNDVTKSESDIKNNDYYDFGTDVADMLVLFVGKIPQIDSIFIQNE